MEFRVLGPMELWLAGRRRDLGPARERGVLAILLLTPGTIVPAETMIERLWDAQPPAKARESLSVYVTRLRASLRQALGDSVRLAWRLNGYTLDVDPEAVDLHQFRRLRREADALVTGGDHDGAAQLLREADGLWHGPALAGIRGDWMARMRHSLEEERRAAILQRVECDLELGRHADLLAELRGLLAQYPLDEKLVAYQMEALYSCGRPGDALSLYRETRGRLVAEQGTEPGAALSELHQRILRQDRQPAVRSGAAHRPGQGGRRDTLPPEPPEFVGRGEELALLAGEHGDKPRVSVIEGMPGVGKTALAVRVARRVADHYPEGVFYLDLQAHDPASPAVDSADALHRLLTMVGVPPTQIPESAGERAALWRAQLSRRRAVVILDDAARHDQVRPLLPCDGRSLILITARRRLPDLEGADVLTLDVLSPDEAATLFARIAGLGTGGDEDVLATAAASCGRLPLAIQLTAGRLAQAEFRPRSVADLVAELSMPPARLCDTSAASPEVLAALELSYRALEPDHRRFFRRLGVSPCARVSPQAAAALGGCTPAEADRALRTLRDHHLLVQADDGQFRFHDLIREFASVRAAEEDSASERGLAVGRLLDFYVHAADAADRVLQPFTHRMPAPVKNPPAASPALTTAEAAAAWLESEWRNILQLARYAGRHEWKRQCADLTHLLAAFVDISGYWDEAIVAHTLALRAARDLDDQARIARASLELCVVSQQTGRHEATLSLAEDAAAIYRSLGDDRGLADALDQIGLVNHRAARSREALAYFSESGILYGEAMDQHGKAVALSHAGIACWHLGRYPDAMDHLREALSLYRDVGDRRGEAKTLNNLGKMQLHCGRHRDALESYERSLRIFGEIGGAQNQAILYHNIGSVYHYKGNYEKGLAAYRRALAIYRAIGDLPDEADVLNDIGAIYQSAECHDEALINYEQARLIAEDIGNVAHQVMALRGIADVRRGSGRCAEASGTYQAALTLARQIGDPYEEAKALEGIAETMLCTDRPHEARIAFRQAFDIFERLGVPEAEAARIRLETSAGRTTGACQ